MSDTSKPALPKQWAVEEARKMQDVICRRVTGEFSLTSEAWGLMEAPLRNYLARALEAAYQKGIAEMREERDTYLRQRNKYATLYFDTQAELEKTVNPCLHKNTEIIEPHLAGARRCLDCGAERGAGSMPYERVER